jgi:hypothetical protein
VTEHLRAVSEDLNEMSEDLRAMSDDMGEMSEDLDAASEDLDVVRPLLPSARRHFDTNSEGIIRACQCSISRARAPEPRFVVHKRGHIHFFLITNLVARFIHRAPSVGDVQTTVHGADAVATVLTP